MSKVIFPPRPKGRILPNDLAFYEKTRKWVVQLKFNGSRNLIHISPEGKINFWSRDGDEHKKTMPSSRGKEVLSVLKLLPNTEYWFDSELMNKTKNAGNQIVIYDVLQAGRYFFGRPNQMERLKILNELCGNPTNKNELAYELSENIWMAETFESNFVEKFKEYAQDDRIEGLVLRRKESFLQSYGDKYYETGDQIRCRREKKNYNF